MTFHIYDDHANTIVPENARQDFRVFQDGMPFHNYLRTETNVEAAEAFVLLATSDDYHDNENVIRLLDTALKNGHAVADGYYSGKFVQAASRVIGEPSTIVSTLGSRKADFDLNFGGSYNDDDFDSEIEKVVCNNQIAIAPFQGAMCIFSGKGQALALDNVDVAADIDTVEYIRNHLDTCPELTNFLGEEVAEQLREAIAAGSNPTI